MGYLEWQMVNRYQGPTPEFYYRYIDDGIGVSTMPLDDLKNYIYFVKTFHPSFPFTSEISTSTVNFLDIKISNRDRFLYSSVYYKQTDSHTYLTYTSSHPHSCKRSIPFSKMLRLRRLCQDDHDFQKQCLRMRDFFV
ncbi:surfeit locus protein 4 [Elysia marginata]|uniref:Surfeit locus protein 4 n=1 Tax=Elysia marginata TaxID=1093978 RepID=A0AAV4I843_9GAST|nr:surfeit locus protein 4 [Elysia marginata]